MIELANKLKSMQGPVRISIDYAEPLMKSVGFTKVSDGVYTVEDAQVAYRKVLKTLYLQLKTSPTDISINAQYGE